MADGIFTPAISVTSAVGGIAVAKPSADNDITAISIVGIPPTLWIDVETPFNRSFYWPFFSYNNLERTAWLLPLPQVLSLSPCDATSSDLSTQHPSYGSSCWWEREYTT